MNINLAVSILIPSAKNKLRLRGMGLTLTLADFQQSHDLCYLWMCQLTPSLVQAPSGPGSYRDTSLLEKQGMVNQRIQTFPSHLMRSGDDSSLSSRYRKQPKTAKRNKAGTQQSDYLNHFTVIKCHAPHNFSVENKLSIITCNIDSDI